MEQIGLLAYDVSLTGGAEKVACQMAHMLSGQYGVHLISLFGEKRDAFSPPSGVQTTYLCENTVSITLHLPSLAARLKRYLRAHNIRVLYAITAGVVTVALAGAVGTAARVIYCEHSNLENKTYGKKHELRQHLGAKRAFRTVTLTERDRRNFLQAFHLSPERVLTVPNAFSPTETADKPYDVTARRLVTAGRLETVKGHDLLLKAAVKIQEKHPDWHWDIFGDGTLREQLQAAIERLGLSAFVTLKGNVSDLPHRLPDYAVFVLTSYYEGLPLVLLEAQTAKLPIVSFDCPTGPSEMVEDGVNGFLVPPYDTDLLAERLCRLMEDDALRQRFSDCAGRFLPNYDKDAVAAQWLALTAAALS